MRILLTADPELSVPPKTYGGVQRLVDGLVRELRFRGHSVGLVARSDSEAHVDAFYPFPGNESQNVIDSVRNTYTVYHAVSDFKPDVLHSFSRLLYLIPILGSTLIKVQTYGRFPGARQVRIANLLAGQSLGFTGCSNHIAETGRIGGGNWKTVYNFVDIEKFTFREQVTHDAPLVFLSRIEKIKGTHTAIKIAKEVGVRLLIAGNKPDLIDAQEYWRNQIEPEIDGEQITYVGPVDDIQKNELLGKARALIVPIEWDEPFGMVFTEALACGTPVISTNRGAVQEIIRDGKEGRIISSIAEGVQAVSELKEINRADCRKRVEELFTRENIAGQYLHFYKELGVTGW